MLRAVVSSDRVVDDSIPKCSDPNLKKNGSHPVQESPRDRFITQAIETGIIDAAGHVLFPTADSMVLDAVSQSEILERLDVRSEGNFRWNLRAFLQFLVPYFKSRMKNSLVVMGQGALSAVGKTNFSRILEKKFDCKMIPEECWSFCSEHPPATEIWISLNEPCTEVQAESLIKVIHELVAVQSLENPPSDLPNALMMRSRAEVQQIISELKTYIKIFPPSNQQPAAIEIQTSFQTRVKIFLIPAGVPLPSFLLDFFHLAFTTDRSHKLQLILASPNPWQGLFDLLIHRLLPYGNNRSGEWALGRYWRHLTEKGAVWKNRHLEPLFQHAEHTAALECGKSEMEISPEALLAFYCNASSFVKRSIDCTDLIGSTPMGMLLQKYSHDRLIPILQLLGIRMTECRSDRLEAPECHCVYGNLQIKWRSDRPHYLVLPFEWEEAIEKIDVTDQETIEALTDALRLFSPVFGEHVSRKPHPKLERIAAALRAHSSQSAWLFSSLTGHIDINDVLDLPQHIDDGIDLAKQASVYQTSSYAHLFDAIQRAMETLPLENRRQAAHEVLLMCADSRIVSRAWSLPFPISAEFLEKSVRVMKKEALSFALAYVCKHYQDNIELVAICLDRLLAQKPPFQFGSTYEPTLYQVLADHLTDPLLNKYPRAKAASLAHALEAENLTLNQLVEIEELISTEQNWQRFDSMVIGALGGNQTHPYFESLCSRLITRLKRRADVTALRTVASCKEVKSLELLTYLTSRRKDVTLEDVASVHRLYATLAPNLSQAPQLCDFFLHYYRTEKATLIASDLQMSLPYFLRENDLRILEVFEVLVKELEAEHKNKSYRRQLSEIVRQLEAMYSEDRFQEAAYVAFPYLDKLPSSVCAIVAARAFEQENDTLVLQAINQSKELAHIWLPRCVMKHVDAKSPPKRWVPVLKAYQTTEAYQVSSRQDQMKLLGYLAENSGSSPDAIPFFFGAIRPDVQEMQKILTIRTVGVITSSIEQQLATLTDRQIILDIVAALKHDPTHKAWTNFTPLFVTMLHSDQFLPLAVEIMEEFVQENRCLGVECFQQAIPQACQRLAESDQRRVAVAYAKALTRAPSQQTKKITQALPSVDWLIQMLNQDETYFLVVDLYIHETTLRTKEIKKGVLIAVRLIDKNDSPVTMKFVRYLAKIPTASLDKDWIPHLKGLILKNPEYHILFPHLIALSKPYASALYVRCQNLHVAGKYNEVSDLFDTENIPKLVERTVKLLKVPRISKTDLDLALAFFDYFNPALYRSFIANHSAEILRVLEGDSRTAITVLFLKMGIATSRGESPDNILDTLRILHGLFHPEQKLTPEEETDFHFMLARSSDSVLHQSGVVWVSGCIATLHLFSSLKSVGNEGLFKRYVEAPFVPQDRNHHAIFLTWIDQCYTIYNKKISCKDACRMVPTILQFDHRQMSQKNPTACFLIALRIWQSVVIKLHATTSCEHSFLFTDSTLQLINHISLLPIDTHGKRVFFNEVRDTIRKQKNLFLHPDHEAQILVYLLSYVFSFDTPERTICSLQDSLSCKNYLTSHADAHSQNAVSTLINCIPLLLKKYREQPEVMRMLQGNIEMLLDLPWVMDEAQKELHYSFESLSSMTTSVEKNAGCHLPIFEKLQGNPRLATRLSEVLNDQQWAILLHQVRSELSVTIFNEVLLEGTKQTQATTSYPFFITAARLALNLETQDTSFLHTLAKVSCCLPLDLWAKIDSESRIRLYLRWTAAVCNISKLLARAQIVSADFEKEKDQIATDVTRLILASIKDVDGCKRFSDLLIDLPKDPVIKQAILRAFIIPIGLSDEVNKQLEILKQILESQMFA